MAPIKLYAFEVSPAVRAVISVLNALNIEYEKEDMNLMAQEQFKPEYLKINPQHTVPTLIDNGFIIWDSHAIVTYLVDKYAKDDSLYPKDLQKRAVVNQRLHFDSGILFPRLCDLFLPILVERKNKIPRSCIDNVVQAYGLLEAILKSTSTEWLACDHVTVADICAANTLAPLLEIIPAAADTFPKIRTWMECVISLPYFSKGSPSTTTYFIKQIIAKSLHEDT